MDLNSIGAIVESVGIPIVCLAACAYYIKILNAQLREERRQMADQEIENDKQLIELVKASNDALLQMRSALVEQTSAMRELVSKLGSKRR